MIYLLTLLLSYGLCFGAINKVGVHHPVKWLRLLEESSDVDSRVRSVVSGFFNKLFTCPYCMGFHTGWMSWLAVWGLTGETLLLVNRTEWWALVSAAVSWSLISAAVCYLLDALAVHLEQS